MRILLLGLLVATASVLASDACHGQKNNNPIFKGPATFITNVTHGKKYTTGPIDNTIYLLHLYGTPYEWGKAYGELMKNEITDMYHLFYGWVDVQIEGFCKQKIPELEPLCKLVEKFGVNAALDIEYWMVEKYVPSWMKEEVRGLAEAINQPFEKVMGINMFPELIRAHCTMIGAWGKAVPNGEGLVQLRALDQGTNGPMQKYPTVVIYHPSDVKYGHPWANVGWSGLIGSLTGYSSAKIGVSEKVFLAYKGKYKAEGTPWMNVLREILMYDNTVEEAIWRMQNAERTCSIYVGIGGAKVGNGDTYQFRGVRYSHDYVENYSDKNFTFYGNHPEMDGLMWWDKHVQPSNDPCLTDLLKSSYGNITVDTYMHTIAPLFQTGDLHIAAMDFLNDVIYVSNAAYAPDFKNGEPAYNRPFTKFEMQALWKEKM